MAAGGMAGAPASAEAGAAAGAATGAASGTAVLAAGAAGTGATGAAGSGAALGGATEFSGSAGTLCGVALLAEPLDGVGGAEERGEAGGVRSGVGGAEPAVLDGLLPGLACDTLSAAVGGVASAGLLCAATCRRESA